MATNESLGTVAAYVCPLMLAPLFRCVTQRGRRETSAWDVGAASLGACSLESLWFYYDDDDELQCECLDDVEEWDDLPSP